MMKSGWLILQTICRIFTIAYCVLVLLIVFGIRFEILAFLELAISYAPKWPALLIAVIALIPNKLQSFKHKRAWLWLAPCLMILWYQDIQLNFPHTKSEVPTVSMLSINTGNGTNVQLFQLMLLLERPDLVLLQESSAQMMEALFDDSWKVHCAGRLCLASQYSFTHLESYSRTLLGGWGDFMATYEVSILNQKLQLANVHLETPRHALSAGLKSLFKTEAAEKFHHVKQIQAQIVGQFLQQSPLAIVAGDLNMTVFEGQYRQHLSQFRNALDVAANGVNYTKFTEWHGVRIDHILAASSVRFTRAEVIEPLGGDHRGIIVEFHAE